MVQIKLSVAFRVILATATIAPTIIALPAEPRASGAPESVFMGIFYMFNDHL